MSALISVTRLQAAGRASLASLVLLAAACSAGPDEERGTRAPVSEPPRRAVCDTAIPWNAAARYVGERATVKGPVVDARYAATSRGRPTFLNIGRPYPDPSRFTVVIWGEHRRRFPTPPETAYAGKTICVTGTIELYRGSPQIVIDGPAAIVVE